MKIRRKRGDFIREAAFIAFVASTFVVLLWATSGTVSDEEIRPDPPRAQAH